MLALKKQQFILPIAVLLLLLLVLPGCTASTPSTQPPSTPVLPATANQTTGAGVPSSAALAALQGTLEDIYTQVNPSVVNIGVVQKEEATFPSIPEIPGFPFKLPTPQEPQQFYSHGLGSGFIWDKQGHIVTNNHVVAGADHISVTFHDGTTKPCKVVGTDPDSDLAVVKVDLSPEQLQPVQMAASRQVKVGQLTAAIGNPFGLQGTMTVGIVSAVGRSLPVESGGTGGPQYTIPDAIQTDAPINPGNSGGVLVDMQGRVIGVTSAITSPVRASAGIGFAIPSAIVEKVVPALIETGHYDHPWLGVSVTSLTPELAKAMDLKLDQRGALVVDVVPGSPADKGGLHGSDRQITIEGQQVRVGGDVIVAVDEQPVKEDSDLIAYLTRSTEVRQTIALALLRQGKEQTVQVTLAARPTTEQAATGQGQKNPTGGAWLGIQGLTVTSEIAQSMGLPADQQGVLVEQVIADSPADEANLRGSYKPVTINGKRLLVGGDIITAVDKQPVTRLDDLQAIIQAVQPGEPKEFTLVRDGNQVLVTVTLGHSPS